MQEFIMMVGLPGCGKDTYIKNNDNFKDFIIVSPDQIRKDNGYEPGAKGDVFSIAFQQIVDSLSLGKSVVYNATNLKNRYRMALLDKLHAKFKDKYIEYYAYIIPTPIKVCKERNALRKGFDRTPEKVIDDMVRSFQTPLLGEGFDDIIFIAPPGIDNILQENYKLKDKYDSLLNVNLYSFNQDNPYHTLSLGEHMDKTGNYIIEHIKEHLNTSCEDCPSLLLAAMYHDVGKVVTKDYHDRKGNSSKTAHYYGHENVGAYLMLSEYVYNWWGALCDENSVNDYMIMIYNIAVFINYHMRVSFTWRNYPDGKCAKREMKLFGDFELACLELLGEADRNAH